MTSSLRILAVGALAGSILFFGPWDGSASPEPRAAAAPVDGSGTTEAAAPVAATGDRSSVAAAAGTATVRRVTAPAVLFSFESGRQGWQRRNDPDHGRVGLQSTFTPRGKRGLRTTGTGDPDYVGTRFEQPLDLSGAGAVKVDLRSYAAATWTTVALVTGPDHRWCQGRTWRHLAARTTATLTVPMASMTCETGTVDPAHVVALYVALGPGTFDLDDVRLHRVVRIADFESGVQGWKPVAGARPTTTRGTARVAGTTRFHAHGRRGLAVTSTDGHWFGTQPADAAAGRRPLRLADADRMSLTLRTTSTHPRARLAVRVGDAGTWCVSPAVRAPGVVAGGASGTSPAPRTVTLDAAFSAFECAGTALTRARRQDVRAVAVWLPAGSHQLDDVRAGLAPDRWRPPAAAAAPAVGTTRIMPLGDSITGAPGCWRAVLWRGLAARGFTGLDFVGSLRRDDCPGPPGFDADTEGHSKYQGAVIARKRLLPAWLAAGRPDVVLMHLGTNDLNHGRTTAQILAGFDTLVRQMRMQNPDMRILVAQIIPQQRATCENCMARVVRLNNALVPWARKRSTTRSPVVLVDQWTGFDVVADTRLIKGKPDRVHPNVTTGIAKLAARWLGPLSAVLEGKVPASSRMTVPVP